MRQAAVNESGIEVRLPEGWEWAKVEQLGDVVTGNTPSTKDRRYYGGSIPLFKPTDLNAGYWVSNSETTLSEEGAKKARVLPAKSILVTCIGATIGKTGLSQIEGATNQQINALVPSDGHVVSEYLYFAFIGSLLQDQVLSNASSTTLPILNKSKFSQLNIPLPPFNEQHRIVEKIEELFTKLDAGVQSLEQARAQLKSYRRSVLKAAVEGELSREWREAHRDELEPASELLERILQERREKFAGKKYKEPISPDTSELRSPPDGWEWASADLLTTVITDGEHITPERSASGVPLLSARNVQNGWLSFEKVDYISESVYETLTRRLLIMPGDVLMSCSGTVGRSCVAPENSRFALVRSVAVLKPLAEMGRFLSYSLRSSLLQEQIHAKKTQTAQANIFQGKIRTLVFALPPLEEQRFIVEEVERRLSVVDKLEATVEASLKQANSLRQSILKRAFSGDLVPQDPADEPASVLLKRIREERQAKKQRPNRGRRGRTDPAERVHAEQGGLF